MNDSAPTVINYTICERHRENLKKYVDTKIEDAIECQQQDMAEFRDWMIRVENKIDSFKFWVLGLAVVIALASIGIRG